MITLTCQYQRINTKNHYRFDPKYYEISEKINKLKKNKSINIKKISELDLDIRSGSYIDEYTEDEKKTRYLRITNIRPHAINKFSNDLVYVEKEKVNKNNYLIENDIILSRTQATVHKLGVSTLIDKKIENSTFSQHITRLRLKNDKVISPLYLVSFLNSRFFKSQMALASHGDTRVEFTHSQFNEVEVVIPKEKDLKEIEKIIAEIYQLEKESSSIILKYQDLVKNKLQLIYKKNNEKKYFSTNFKSFDKFYWTPAYSQPEYNKIINQIKQNFKTIELGPEIVELNKGNEVGSENYVVDIEKDYDSIPFIRTSDLINYEIDDFPDYFIDKKIYEDLNQDINAGDILFNNDGKIGVVAMVLKNDKFILQSHVQRIRLTKKAKEKYLISPEYLFLMMSIDEVGLLQSKKYTVYQSTIPTIGNNIQKFIIPILDKNLIVKITSELKRAFHLKQKRKDLIQKARSKIDQLTYLI